MPKGQPRRAIEGCLIVLPSSQARDIRLGDCVEVGTRAH